MSKNIVWIFDIDGTLADNHHRESILEYRCDVCLTRGLTRNEPCFSCGSGSSTLTTESWEKFIEYDVAIKDKPIANALSTLRKLRSMKATIRFVTSRDRKTCERVTVDWLNTRCGWQESEERLYMREDHEEGIPPSVYKERCVMRIKEELGEDTIIVGFDDDPTILQAYAKHGIAVKCPEGWDSFLTQL